MKSIRLLKKRLIEGEVQFTNNINEALWLLPDGTMLDGEYDGSCRGQDHRIIEAGITKYDRYDGEKFWNECHHAYNLVRLVPETGYALIGTKQQLTPEQETILKRTTFEIERY